MGDENMAVSIGMSNIKTTLREILHAPLAIRRCMCLGGMVLLVLGLSGKTWAQTDQDQAKWVETFSIDPAIDTFATPHADLPKDLEYLGFDGPVSGTFRYRFAISVGGSQVRVKVSNECSDKPMRINGASIAQAGDEMNAVPGSLERLTFNHQNGIYLAPGAYVISDPIAMSLKPMAELITSVYTEDQIDLFPLGGAVMLQAADDQVMNPKLVNFRKVARRPLVSAVYVLPDRPTHVIVGLGDSITDGVRNAAFSEPRGWVDQLARRLSLRTGNIAYAAVSAGIGGNRVLRPGFGQATLARVDRDVFSIPGVTDIIFLEGINDICFSGGISILPHEPILNIDDLLAQYSELAAQAHLRGLRIYVGTLTPFGGSIRFNEQTEKMRASINAWIRSSKDFDGVVDFDAILKDPSSPLHLKAEYDSGDHLHPSAAGYKAMADGIDLNLFR